MPSPLFWYTWCWPLCTRAGPLPAAVILVVPVALVGVLLALIIRGYDNNLYTQVGLVLMIALASKNAILIVEFARDLHREGMSITEAAIEATRRRFRPIVMTSFAFILGVVPLLIAFGAGRRQPAGHRHGRFRRHALFDASGHPVCARLLRAHPAIRRAQEKGQGNFPHRAGGGNQVKCLKPC